MLNFAEYSNYDATDLARLVDKKELSARELAETAMAGVEAVNPALNAVIETFPEAIDELDEQGFAGQPFGGVPFFLKDLGAGTEGQKCEWGSCFAKGLVIPETNHLTQQFIKAGLTILGRTTCPELGLTLSTESMLNGVSYNPWDTALTPGGSSGGSSALVAAGVTPVAHTNDGGGSTRIPASMCGLVGLKCSRGAVSLGPAGGDVKYPLYSEFACTRTVRDTERMLDAIAGPAPGESVYSQLRAPSNRHGRIAVSSGKWGAFSATPLIASKLDLLAATLSDLGYQIELTDPPIDFEEVHAIVAQFFSMTASVEIDTMAQALGQPVSPDCFEPITYRMYQHGHSFGIRDYVKALEKMNEYARTLGQFYEEFDYLVTPTLAAATPLANIISLNQDVSIEEFYQQVNTVSPYTAFNNFTGTPAISLPLYTHGDGTPLGMQIQTSIGGDRNLIKLAYELEEALPWRKRRPQIHLANMSGLVEAT